MTCAIDGRAAAFAGAGARGTTVVAVGMAKREFTLAKLNQLVCTNRKMIEAGISQNAGNEIVDPVAYDCDASISST